MFLFERLQAEAFLSLPIKEGKVSCCDIFTGEITISPEEMKEISSRLKISITEVFWASVLHEAGHYYDPLRLERGGIESEKEAWRIAKLLLEGISKQLEGSPPISRLNFAKVRAFAMSSHIRAERYEALLKLIEN